MPRIHLAGGILALAFANIAALLDRAIESRRIVVDITAWYCTHDRTVDLYLALFTVGCAINPTLTFDEA